MRDDEYRKMFELEDRYWWFRSKRALVRMLIEQYAPSHWERGVDLGCGTGGIMADFSARKGTWFGVDQSPIALNLARSRGLRRLARGSIDRVPLRSGFADIVMVLDVLYHRWVADDRSALAEAVRLLRPGGTVIITDSALDWLRGPHDQAVFTRKRYRLDEVVKMAERSGVKIIKKSYANGFLFAPTAIFRLARRLFPGTNGVSDIVAMPSCFQRVLESVTALERMWLRYAGLPIGTTVVLVGKKPCA